MLTTLISLQGIPHGEILQSGKCSHSLNKDNIDLLLLSLNGGSAVVVDQPDTGGGNVLLSVPVKLALRSGSNSITLAANQNSKKIP